VTTVIVVVIMRRDVHADMRRSARYQFGSLIGS
jgi:hypothetical protein